VGADRSAAPDPLTWAWDALRGLGRFPTADPVEVKDRPWSRVVRLPTGAGPVWLKVNRGGTTYEPALVSLLAHLVPGAVEAPLASRGPWWLSADGGPTLRASRGDAPLTGQEMAAVLAEYAVLQQASAEALPTLLDAGVPDLRPEHLPSLLRGLLDDQEWMRVGLEGGMPETTYRRLLARLPEVDEACERLAGSPVPMCVQHDDLHDNNVFAGTDAGGTRSYRIFDWGDASVGHPFATLLVSLRSFATARSVPVDDPAVLAPRDAYLACWSELASMEDLAADADLAVRLAPIGRALSWRRALLDAEGAERARWGANVWGWLEELLV